MSAFNQLETKQPSTNTFNDGHDLELLLDMVNLQAYHGNHQHWNSAENTIAGGFPTSLWLCPLYHMNLYRMNLFLLYWWNFLKTFPNTKVCCSYE